MLPSLLLLKSWPGLLMLAAMAPNLPASLPNADAIHAWSGHVDPASLSAWVAHHLEAEQLAVDQLLAVKDRRTVANTVAPYDRAVAELSLAGSEAALLYSVSPEKAVRDQAEAMVQKISVAATQLSLNPQVYHALAAVDVSTADPATRHYMERTLLQYRIAGVDKDEATRKRVQELQERITQLSLTFGRNVQEHVNTVQVADTSELDGLPQDFLSRHKSAADGRITLTTDYPDYQPVMTYAKSDSLRHRMFLAYNTRAYPANKQVLLDLLTTRQELATTLGFKTWADLATADQMMASAANARSFLAELDAASKSGAAKEYTMVLDFARQHQPGLTGIDAASATYWYEQYRRTAFDFDSQSVRPYFPYEQVQQGVLDTAAKLFHVEFRPSKDATVWDASVSAWDVYDRSPQSPRNGQLIGRFYLDMHPREGKDKWFSAYPLVPGVLGKQIPEAALICNFPGGHAAAQGDDPGLMQYSDVVTFFHEFGHLMHAILGGQQQWAGISGISTEGDFVEAPSQMLEEFFRSPKLLQSFARNYKTGEPLPTETIDKMNRASAFGRGNWVRGQLFYTRFALDVHDRPPASINLDTLMKTDYTDALPYTWVSGNRFYASFTHLTGYSSNYYTYLFDKVIALDFYSQFDRDNLIGGSAALRYRQLVLEPGGSEPGADLVKGFLGRPQNLKAFEKWMNEEFAVEKSAQ
jgi:thimet oligopeptidase